MCDTCPSFDKESEMCGKKIKDLKDEKCFFKNILWMLSGIHDGIWAMVDDAESGEDWKGEL